MTLRRISAATVFPVSVAEAKDQARVDGDATDRLILHYIAAANAVIGEMAGYVLGGETWEMTVTDVSGAVAVPLLPVTALVSVTQAGDTLSGFALSADGDCFIVSGPWPAGEVEIRVTVGGVATVPAELKQAMLTLIAYWLAQPEAASAEALSPVPFAVADMVSLHRRGWMRA